MAKHLKTWTTLSLAVLGSASLSAAAPAPDAPHPSAALHQPLVLAQTNGEAGEGGEGGSEGGGSSVTSYALESTDPTAFQYDAAPQIAAYAELVQTSYTKAAAEARAMQGAIAAFLAAPSAETLAKARGAWVAARPAYLLTEAFRFYDGPIEAAEGGINAWPMNEAYVDYVEGNPKAGLVNDPAVGMDLGGLESLNQKQDEADVTTGWHAIEFLLWGQDLSADGPGNRPFTDYIAGQANNDRRRAYLELVTAELVHELDELAEAWEPGKGDNYAAKFLQLPPREAIGRMINGMAILAGYELMSERLAVALDSGDQEDEHSCFSDTTKQDFVHDLAGIQAVWTGAKLDQLLRAQDEPLASRMDGLIADAEAKIARLGDPWDQVLARPKNSPERQAAEDVVTALEALGKGFTDTGAKLGVLVLIPSE